MARWAFCVGMGLLISRLGAARYATDRLDYAGIRSTRVVDREGRMLFEVRGGRGTYQRPVALADVSRFAVLATLAGEDAAFRRHVGVDPLAIARALWLDAKERTMSYGGSTITQQLAKNLAPEPRTLGGKLREAWAAYELECTLTKDEILEQYLNRADYGRGATGIEAAALRYFGKAARELTLAEAALLAILPRAPSLYDPVKHPERATKRRAHVLGLMEKRGWVSTEDAKAAAAEPLHFVVPPRPLRAPHVLDLVASRGLIPRGAAAVRLTIDVELQESLERRVRSHLELLEEAGVDQAGIVIIEPFTGDVLAMVGSRRYGEVEVAGSVNATTALRAPGSTLKPFVYAVALEDGAHPATPVLDAPIHFRGYYPRSLGDHYFGAVALRDALGSSLNIPAVRVADTVGIERVAALLHDAGLGHLNLAASPGLSLALGGTSVPLVELTNAYATLARGGEYLPWRIVAGVPTASPHRVLTRETAFLLTDALADPGARELEFGLETPLDLPFPVAAKTGTSQAYTDNVAVGYTPEFAIGVWVGNFDGRPLKGLLAMRGAAPLFREAMLRAHRGRPSRAFAVPPGVVKLEVCAEDGLLPGPGCVRRRLEWVAIRNLDRIQRADPAATRGASMLSGALSREGRVAPGVTITVPRAGSRFVIDPLLDPNRQRLALRAEVGGSGPVRVRWLVDGGSLGEARVDEAAHWTLTPGRHRIRVEAVEDAAACDEIELEVEG